MSQEQVQSIYKVSKFMIKGFFEKHRFLSNFHVCKIYHDGFIYSSTEAAYQASKSLDTSVRVQFTALTPYAAQKKGQTIKIREDWDDVKLQIMYDINYTKYVAHEELYNLLYNTGTKYLEETNWWHDIFWGVCNGVGQNKLGETLMQLREDLQK